MVHIRRATAADSLRVADVYLSAVHVGLPWLQLVHTDDQVRDWIAGHVVPDLPTWVAELGGAAVGTIVLVPPTAANDTAWVDHLYVDPPYQGRGVGDRLIGFAKECHPRGLQLWTFQRNTRARAFYEHRGFAAVEFTDGAGNEEREPDVRYAWAGDSGRWTPGLRLHAATNPSGHGFRNQPDTEMVVRDAEDLCSIPARC